MPTECPPWLLANELKAFLLMQLGRQAGAAAAASAATAAQQGSSDRIDWKPGTPTNKGERAINARAGTHY